MAAKTRRPAAPRPAPRPARRAPRQRAAPAPKLDLDLLGALSNAVAVSGDEGPVRRLVLDAIRPHADEVRVDALGNVLAVKRAAGKPVARVLVAAHMDEVGLMVVDHDADGGLRFEVVGSVAERVLVGKPVLLGARRLPGVIGAVPIHLLTAERRTALVKTGQMRIDIGASTQEAARRQVPVGERAGFATEFAVLAGAVRGKALDNRLGCANLVALLRAGPYPVELHAAFTVQEEVGLRGAGVVAHAVAPDAAIALDCTPAADLPHSQPERENVLYNARLGQGPVIYVADSRTIHDRRLVDALRRAAEAAGLPYQLRQPGAGSTDAAAIQQTGAGVPVVSLSVPGRYLHTPASLARLADWENTLRLAYTVLKTFTARILK